MSTLDKYGKNENILGMIRNAETKTTTFTSDGFKRTALILDGREESGSVDLVRMVNGKPVRVAQVNISYMPNSDGEEVLIVDVIDVETWYEARRALVFSPNKRECMDVPKGGNLVSADFRRPTEK